MTTWFIKTDYLESKLAQLIASGQTSYTNIVQVDAAIQAAGFTAEEHFMRYGSEERTSPNKLFQADEYLAAKAIQMNKLLGSSGDWTADKVALAIKDAGLTIWDHFNKYGWAEGVNPSNSFDVSSYLDAKLAALQAAEPAAGWTLEKLTTAFQNAGLSPLTHYYEYGQGEHLPVTPVPAEEQVPSAGGNTFTLTTGADNIVGTSGNDTINGGLTAATGATIQAIDTIDGGAGTDTLNTTASNAGDILGGALVKNVENINVRVTAGTAATLDASSAAGLTNINANLGAGTLVATNLAKGAAVTVTGDGTVANGEVAFSYATATDAVTLNVAGGTKMTAAITAKAAGLGGTATGTATTATINSTGAANVVGTVDLANATLTSVTVNAATNLKGDFLSQATDQVGTDGVVTIAGAAASVEFTAALDNTIKSIDASGLTAGGLTAILGSGITSFKGGQGNDVITTAATTAAGAVIDAGAGTADKLILAATNDVNTAAKGAQYTNFEILGLNNSQDVSLISGITALELNAMTSKAISKISAAQAAAITVTGDQTTALTLTLADATGTADAVSLNLKSATATNNVDVNGLSIVGVETLSVAATTGSAGDASAVSFANSGADKLTAINVSGAANSSFAGGNTAKAINLNSTATGNVTLTGNWVTGSSFTLAGGKDVITLGTGFNTYNSGAGDDTFNATAAQLNTGADYNVINGGEGTDTLNITGGGALTIVDNNLSKITNIEKIVVATTNANNQSISTGGWFDAAFKASGVDLTTVATTGNIVIDMTSFTGAAKISATTVGTGGGEGAINIQTGSGADNITVSAAAAGDTGIVSTFGGDDKITTAGTEAFTITAGQGNDTIVLGSSGIETVVFEATAALNGTDAITGFTLGAAGDILNVSSFIGAAKAVTVGATIGTGATSAIGSNVLTLTDIQDLTASNFGGAASTTVIQTAANQKLFVAADKAGDVDAIQNLYYVTTDASNVATVTLVGTVNEGTFHADNFTTV